MKTLSSLLIILFASCLQEEKIQSRELDYAALDVQRAAFWHREYSFEVTKWKGVNEDSVNYYVVKKDSALAEYRYYNRRFNDLVELYKKQK